jgi:hypothetical protein
VPVDPIGEDTYIEEKVKRWEVKKVELWQLRFVMRQTNSGLKWSEIWRSECEACSATWNWLPSEHLVQAEENCASTTN